MQASGTGQDPEQVLCLYVLLPNSDAIPKLLLRIVHEMRGKMLLMFVADFHMSPLAGALCLQQAQITVQSSPCHGSGSEALRAFLVLCQRPQQSPDWSLQRILHDRPRFQSPVAGSSGAGCDPCPRTGPAEDRGMGHEVLAHATRPNSADGRPRTNHRSSDLGRQGPAA